MRCQCTGNCLSKCPARSSECPNAATVNLTVEGRCRKKPLCGACSCRQPGCTSSARRPFGQFMFMENYGYCPRHHKGSKQPETTRAHTEVKRCAAAAAGARTQQQLPSCYRSRGAWCGRLGTQAACPWRQLDVLWHHGLIWYHHFLPWREN